MATAAANAAFDDADIAADIDGFRLDGGDVAFEDPGEALLLTLTVPFSASIATLPVTIALILPELAVTVTPPVSALMAKLFRPVADMLPPVTFSIVALSLAWIPTPLSAVALIPAALPLTLTVFASMPKLPASMAPPPV